MAKLFLLVALCLFQALISDARPCTTSPLVAQGRVYCDTCRAGFETPASTFIQGATVKVECKDRKTMKLQYSQDAKTDSTGTYKLTINEDHEDEVCEVRLINSPQPDCSKVSPGRDRARVALTRLNGIASNNRYANNIGFMRDQALSSCSRIMMLYQENDI